MNKNDSHKRVDENNETLLRQQRMDVESELERISNIKLSKGKTAAIFKTFNKIKEKSKDGPELVAMKNPETNDFIFSPAELKKAFLKYYSNLPDNRKIADEIECEKLVHYLRTKIDTFEED